jgi:ABC-2 type transport system permease protein
MSMVSLILGMFFRFNPMPVIMLVMWPLMFLSGTFSKEIYIPGASEFMPPAIIQQASFDLTLFGQPDRSIVVLLVSIAILVLSTVVGTALFNRKEMTA